jgi:Tol biopolymer transport system component
MNADGSDSRKLFSPGSTIESFAMSPNGKILRYFRDSSLWETTELGTNPHQLLRDWKPSRHMCCGAWSPDGSIFAFVAAPRRQLWALDERSRWFHKPSGQPVPLSSSPTEWGNPVFSKDGKQIFATGSTLHGELVRLDDKSKQFVPFLSGISANLLSFSKDGRTVAYATYPDDSLWKSNVDGTGRIQLTDSPLRAESVSMAPDGRQVAFMAHTGSGNARAYVISSLGAGPQLLFPQGAGPETDPAWSPDGHRIAFATYELGTSRNHPSEIRILDVDSRQVTTLPDCADKYSPHWSPDGQSLVASRLDNAALYVFDFRTMRWTQIYKGISAYTSWSHDGRFIYTLRFASDLAVLRIPVKGGTVVVVADLKDVRFTGVFGLWLGLDPADAPLLLRDVGTSDVYALNLEQK